MIGAACSGWSLEATLAFMVGAGICGFGFGWLGRSELQRKRENDKAAVLREFNRERRDKAR